jgi:hypothetical protein
MFAMQFDRNDVNYVYDSLFIADIKLLVDIPRG